MSLVYTIYLMLMPMGGGDHEQQRRKKTIFELDIQILQPRLFLGIDK